MNEASRLGIGISLLSDGAADWSPLMLTNINAWYDASDISTMRFEYSDPLKVSKWYDKVGGVKVYTAADVTAPSYSSADGVVFSGAQYMSWDHTLGAGDTNITVAFVVKLTANNGKLQYLQGHNGTGGQISMHVKSDMAALQLNGGAIPPLTSTATTYSLLSSQYRLVIFNYIAGGTSTILGVKAGSPSGDITGSGNAGARTYTSANKIFLGSLHTGADYFLNGNIKTMISTRATLTTDEITNLKNYCEKVYGSAK